MLHTCREALPHLERAHPRRLRVLGVALVAIVRRRLAPHPASRERAIALLRRRRRAEARRAHPLRAALLRTRALDSIPPALPIPIPHAPVVALAPRHRPPCPTAARDGCASCPSRRAPPSPLARFHSKRTSTPPYASPPEPSCVCPPPPPINGGCSWRTPRAPKKPASPPGPARRFSQRRTSHTYISARWPTSRLSDASATRGLSAANGDGEGGGGGGGRDKRRLDAQHRRAQLKLLLLEVRELLARLRLRLHERVRRRRRAGPPGARVGAQAQLAAAAARHARIRARIPGGTGCDRASALGVLSRSPSLPEAVPPRVCCTTAESRFLLFRSVVLNGIEIAEGQARVARVRLLPRGRDGGCRGEEAVVLTRRGV